MINKPRTPVTKQLYFYQIRKQLMQTTTKNYYFALHLKAIFHFIFVTMPFFKFSKLSKNKGGKTLKASSDGSLYKVCKQNLLCKLHIKLQKFIISVIDLTKYIIQYVSHRTMEDKQIEM